MYFPTKKRINFHRKAFCVLKKNKTENLSIFMRKEEKTRKGVKEINYLLRETVITVTCLHGINL